MAAYNSQPKQFTAYTPEVDSDLYGKTLQKKEMDYQKGIQAVEQTGQKLAASLPIANNAVRGMVQEKFNNITNELNNTTGIDFSDRAIQKATSQHIASIANDPLVLHHVAQTAALRKEYNNAKQGAENSDGADVANQYAFNQQASAYINSQDPNASFKGKYVNYVNADKLVHDHMKSLHPDLDENTLLAGQVDPATGKVIPQLSSYDQIIKTYKGIDRDKVLTQLNQLIATTPGLQDQLNVNADYQGKDYNGHDFAKQTYNQISTEVYGLERQKNQLLQQLSLAKDPNFIKQLQEKTKSIDVSINDFSDRLKSSEYFNTVSSVYDALPREVKQQHLRELYMNTYKAEQSNLYSWYEHSQKVAGKSPWEKVFDTNEFNYEKAEDAKKDARDDKRLSLEEDKAAKEKKAETPTYIDLGVQKDASGIGAYDKLGNEIKTNQSIIDQQKLAYLNSKIPESLRSKVLGSNNGVYQVKNNNIVDPETGQNISAQKYLDNIYSKLEQAYNTGTYNNGKNNGVNLDKIDLGYFSGNRLLNREQQAATTRKNRADNELEDYINTNLNVDDKNIHVKYGNVDYKITNKDIKDYLNAKDDEQKDGRIHHVMLPVEYSPELMKMLNTDQNKKSEILNKSVESSSRLYRPWETQITNGKEENNVKVVKTAVGILNAARSIKGPQGITGSDPYPTASKILSAAEEKKDWKDVNIGYWTDNNTGKVYMRVANGSNFENVEVTPQQAKSLHWSTTDPNNTINKILDLNDNNGYSNTGDGNIMTYDNALSKGFVNKGQLEVRYHFIRTSDGVYTKVYTIDPKVGPSSLKMHDLDPVESVGQAEEILNSWLNNYK